MISDTTTTTPTTSSTATTNIVPSSVDSLPAMDDDCHHRDGDDSIASHGEDMELKNRAIEMQRDIELLQRLVDGVVLSYRPHPQLQSPRRQQQQSSNRSSALGVGSPKKKAVATAAIKARASAGQLLFAANGDANLCKRLNPSFVSEEQQQQVSNNDFSHMNHLSYRQQMILLQLSGDNAMTVSDDNPDDVAPNAPLRYASTSTTSSVYSTRSTESLFPLAMSPETSPYCPRRITVPRTSTSSSLTLLEI